MVDYDSWWSAKPRLDVIYQAYVTYVQCYVIMLCKMLCSMLFSVSGYILGLFNF
jgi:hypothetical protein